MHRLAKMFSTLIGLDISTNKTREQNGIENRHPMVEALVYNFDMVRKPSSKTVRQMELFAETA